MRDKAIQGSCLFIFLCLATTAYYRNTTWFNEITLWEDHVNKSPRGARIHYNLATAYASKSLWDKALEEFMIATMIDPCYSTAYNNMGMVYVTIKQPEKAIASFKKAIECNPSNYEAKNNLNLINTIKFSN